MCLAGDEPHGDGVYPEDAHDGRVYCDRHGFLEPDEWEMVSL